MNSSQAETQHLTDRHGGQAPRGQALRSSWRPHPGYSCAHTGEQKLGEQSHGQHTTHKYFRKENRYKRLRCEIAKILLFVVLFLLWGHISPCSRITPGRAWGIIWGAWD